MTLTAAQRRILQEVRERGERTYNGRARKTIERLETLGLVTVDYDMRPQMRGSGIELTEKITVRPSHDQAR